MSLLAVAGVVLVAAIAGAVVALGGGGSTDARAALEQAGCTLSATPALAGDHSVTTPEGTSTKWKTTPPTSGPHYAVPVVYGIYDEPVNQGQLVHNLEHGAVAVQYGNEVSPATIQQLKSFAQEHPRGTVLAPFPALGSQIALGAWVIPNPENTSDLGTAYLAKCDAFDEKAFDAFFDAYQFQGPERFPPDSLLPGRT